MPFGPWVGIHNSTSSDINLNTMIDSVLEQVFRFLYPCHNATLENVWQAIAAGGQRCWSIAAETSRRPLV
jgi:hypothetical protein